jgi:stalled ribosome rescue protein Dom34
LNALPFLKAMPRRRRRRGYPLAVLIGLDGDKATTWHVFSESVRPGDRIQGDDRFQFYESIVNLLRPSLKQGTKSVLIATDDEKEYRRFLGHIEKHQSWLLKGWGLNTASFEHVSEPAMDIEQVRRLVKAHGFREKLSEVTQGDIGQVMDVLEKRLSDPEGIETVLFSLNEVEDAVYGGGGSPEYILVTELFRSRRRRRTDRLLQVAANKKVRTRIIENDTQAGARLSQFGGLVCMLRD